MDEEDRIEAWATLWSFLALICVLVFLLVVFPFLL